MISQSELKELVSYDESTGIFRYIKKMKRINVGDIAGRKAKFGYWQIGLLGKSYLAHRLAWLYMYGEWPKDQIDHINHIRDDNRFCNLREATNITNHRNRPMQKNNTSGFVGVFWEKAINKWRAQIRIEGKNIHVGVFIDISDAVKARKAANIQYGFHENHGISI